MVASFSAYMFTWLNTHNHPMKEKVLSLDPWLSSGVGMVSQVTFDDVWIHLYCHSWEKGRYRPGPGSDVSRPLHKLFFSHSFDQAPCRSNRRKGYVGLLLEATVHHAPAHAIVAPTFKMSCLHSISLV